MPKGYIVVTEDIKDPEGIKAYMAEAAKSFSPEIKILAMDPNAEYAEGDVKGQVVLMEFESLEAAKAWYYSDGYQKAVPLRQAAADCNTAIFSGF
jgi:uncharacterized protein (DUF1330 family)